MKKRIAAVLLIMVLVLSGCHGSKGLAVFEMPERFDETKNIEITFWAKNDTNKTQIAVYQSAVEGFQKLYPNVKVNIRFYTDYGRIYNDVITNIATGTQPNVCITYPDHIATYITGANVVVPLESLMEDSTYGLGSLKVIDEYLEEGRIGGKQYALPFMRSTEACYINKTFVEKLGYEVPDILTWDFVWEVCGAAMEKDASGNFKINGQQIMIPLIYKSTDNMMIQMLRQLGADYSDENGNIMLFNDSAKQILYTVAEHTANGEFSTFKISSYPANFFNAGQCIFGIDSTAGATWMGSDAPLLDIPEDQIVEFETVVRTIPQFDTSNPVMISQGPSVCIFNKEDPQEVLASWLFVKYLLSDEIQTAYAKTEGYVPVTENAQNCEEYRDYLSHSGEDNNEHYNIKIEASEMLMANTDNTFTTPVFNGSASLRNAAGDLIEDTAKAVRRKQTVDDTFLEKEFVSVTSLYRLDQIYAFQNEKTDLGPLPSTSVILLITLAAVWVIIALTALISYNKKRKHNN